MSSQHHQEWAHAAPQVLLSVLLLIHRMIPGGKGSRIKSSLWLIPTAPGAPVQWMQGAPAIPHVLCPSSRQQMGFAPRGGAAPLPSLGREGGRDVHFITRWQVFKNKSAEQQPALAADQSFDIAKDKSRFGKILFSPCSLSHAIIPVSDTGEFVGLLCCGTNTQSPQTRFTSLLRVIKLC